MKRLDTWSVLAGLRFLMSSIVAFNHMGELADLGPWALVVRFGAFEAILGFLLISGYSVSHSYRRHPEGFLWRRVQRIWPVYGASLLLTLAVATWVQQQPLPDLLTLLINGLLLNQALTTTSYVGPAWSLSLEFWLYASLPLLVRLEAHQTRRLLYVSLAAYAVYTVGRTALHLPYYSGVGGGANLLLLSFMWLAGMRLTDPRVPRAVALRDIGRVMVLHLLLGLLIQFGHRLKHQALADFVATDLPTTALQALTLALVYAVFSRVIPRATGGQPSPLLKALGDLSYPLYLIHIPVFVLAARAGLRSPLPMFLLALLASWAAWRVLDGYSRHRDRHSERASNRVPAARSQPVTLAAGDGDSVTGR